MSYMVHKGACRIGIVYEYRDPVDNTFTKKVNGVADYIVSSHKQPKEFKMILQQSEIIVEELNKLNEEIISLKKDLAVAQASALFDTVTSKRVIELQQKLREKKNENDYLVNSIYRKTDEFYEEKKKLLLENNALRKKNEQSIAMVEVVRKTELSKIPTDELARELYSRMENLDKLEKSHNKLLSQHKKAAVMIAELKKQ